MKSLEERFWAKVVKTEGCWLWVGSTNQNGYGRLSRGGRGSGLVAAHRFSYERTYGPVPPDKEVLHKCDNPPCVRPDHLFVGTQQVNMDDMASKGRRKAPHLHGQDNGRAKLTVKEVGEIRRRFALGDSRSVLARQYKVRWRVIDRIVKGKAWKVTEVNYGVL